MAKVPSAASKAGAALKSMADSFASGIGIGAGIEVFRKTLGSIESLTIGAARALGDYSDKMVTLGARTGLTLSSLQLFNAMAKTSGTDVDTLAKAAVKMEVAIGKGDSSFAKLGLSLSSLKAMAPDAAFAKVAESIGAIEDPMQRASAAVAIFGKSGAEMLPLFASNMSEARKQAEEFGLVLSDKTITSAEALGDAIDLMGMSVNAFMMRLAGLIAQSPAVMGAIDAISRAFGSMGKSVEGSQGVFDEFVQSGIDYLGRFALGSIEMAEVVIEAFNGVKLAVMALVDTFLAMNQMLPTGKLLPLDKWRAELAQMAGATADANTKQINALEGMHQKMERLIQDQHALGFAAVKSGGGKGGPGGSFDGSAASVMKPVWEDVLQKWEAQFWEEQRKFQAFKEGMFRDLPKPKDYWKSVTGKDGMDMLSDADKNRETYTFTKTTITASQALQNFANITVLSTSKFGKSIASIAGGLSGILAGKDSLKGLGGGLAGILEKVTGVGSIISAGLGVFSGIKSLFGGGKPKTPPPEPPKQATAAAWASFAGDQQGKGAAGVLAGVSGIRVTSPEDMAAQASIASQSFWAMFKTQGLIKAADAFKAVRDKMLETFKAAGASDEAVGAMLGGVSTMVDLAGNEAFRGAADGANGFSEALAAIANQQLPMTIDQFRAFENQALAGYEQMKAAAIAQGLSAEESIKVALQGSAQYIQTLRDAAAKYGIDLGAGTQNLMDLAGQNGIAMASDVQERLILSLNALTEALGGAPPKFEQAISNGGRNAAGGVGGGDSLAEAMDRGFNGLGKMIVEGISRIPAPQIYMDTGALVGEIAGAVDRGMGSALATSLEGRG